MPATPAGAQRSAAREPAPGRRPAPARLPRSQKPKGALDDRLRPGRKLQARRHLHADPSRDLAAPGRADGRLVDPAAHLLVGAARSRPLRRASRARVQHGLGQARRVSPDAGRPGSSARRGSRGRPPEVRLGPLGGIARAAPGRRAAHRHPLAKTPPLASGAAADHALRAWSLIRRSPPIARRPPR